MSKNKDKFMETSNVEFDVNLKCENCVSAVRKAVSGLTGVTDIQIDLEKQSVIVETSLPSQTIKDAIQSTGKMAVLKGLGSSSAVAEMQGQSGVVGVVRFHQAEGNLCVIDGTIDGLQPGEHGLHIHEYGDLSQDFHSIGLHFNPKGSNHGGPESNERHVGDLGNILADCSGRASFRMSDSLVKVDEIIGRSLAVTSDKDDLGQADNKSSKVDGNSGNGLAYAIIARASGLFQNPKRICQCDGVSIWDETSKSS